jgi:glycosyltransferase involved in cell wall biosynthesis
MPAPADQPLVSILMNCYNGERYLAEAIDSVLAQTCKNWEIIFWDNQSTDRSAEICKGYGEPRIRYFRSDRHTSLGEARALALEQAQGEYIAVLDVDDVWLPRKLEVQLPLFADPEVGIVISDTLFFTDNGAQRQLFGSHLPPQGYVFGNLLKNYFCSLETVVLRRRAIDALGQAFDSALSHISDFDLIVRLSKDWKLVCVGEVLAKWRVHASSGSWAEPDRFYREKMQFVQKMDALPEYASLWAQSRPSFVRDSIVSEAIAQLARNERGLCRTWLAPYFFSATKATLVYLATWLPFANVLVQIYRRRKAMV